MKRRGFFAALVALPALLKAKASQSVQPKRDATFTFYGQAFHFTRLDVLELIDRSREPFDVISLEMDAAATKLRNKVNAMYWSTGNGV